MSYHTLLLLLLPTVGLSMLLLLHFLKKKSSGLSLAYAKKLLASNTLEYQKQEGGYTYWHNPYDVLGIPTVAYHPHKKVVEPFEIIELERNGKYLGFQFDERGFLKEIDDGSGWRIVNVRDMPAYAVKEITAIRLYVHRLYKHRIDMCIQASLDNHIH